MRSQREEIYVAKRDRVRKETLHTSYARGVPGEEVFREGVPVEFVRDMAGGVSIFRPNLSKRLAETADAGRGVPEDARAEDFVRS